VSLLVFSIVIFVSVSASKHIHGLFGRALTSQLEAQLLEIDTTYQKDLSEIEGGLR
jgi:hypothetical protein